MKRRRAKDAAGATRWLASLLLVACSLTVRGQFVVVVPNNLYVVEGDTASTLPFGYPSPFTMRYQQVYESSQFSNAANAAPYYTNYFAALTNGGWISDLFFRAASRSCPFFETVSNVEIHLSTTSRPPDGLSPIFSENIGPDDTPVFSGSFTLSSSSCLGAPEPPDDHVTLSTNFWYDPRVGNLLVDVRLYQGIEGGGASFDAAGIAGDTVSRVYADSVDATNGITDTTGLVTFFAMAPRPTLQVYITATNYMTIRWLTQPTTFVLQQSASLGPDSVWQTVPGTSATNVAFKEYQVSLSPGVGAAFFRLAIPTGQ